MGDTTKASGESSTAMGDNTTASGDASTAIGTGTQARSYGEVAIGLYNTNYVPGSATGCDTSDRLFVIGKGQSGSSRCDAMVIWKNGDTKLYGKFRLGGWASATSDVVCRNGDTLSICSSSRRHKERVERLALGLAAVERMQPVAFKWKDREEYDLGFVAEAVAEVDPLLVTYNEEGEIEGVKYRQLTAVLVNAIKEQQTQIEAQRQEAEERVAAQKAEM